MANTQGIYIALFGRPADQSGLAWLNNLTNDGTDHNNIGVLAQSDEYKAILNSSDDLDNLDRDYIAEMYQNMFDRPADLSGLEFYLDLHRTGGHDLPTLAMKMAAAASGTDALTLASKIDAADLFTAELDEAAEVAAYQGTDAILFGRSFIDAVQAEEPDEPGYEAYVEQQVQLLVSGSVDFVP